MKLRKMGFIAGFALVVGALISLALPDDPNKTAEKVFNEVNFESQDLRLSSERLIATRLRLLRGEGSLADQPVLQSEADALVVDIDRQLSEVADWVVQFAAPPMDGRTEWLVGQRDAVRSLLAAVRALDRKGRVLLGDPGAS